MTAPKAIATDFYGRFREIISDPNNLRIPRVEYAGLVVEKEDTGKMVISHSGVLLSMESEYCYYRDFIGIMAINRGVHEPQEEYCFQEILKRMDGSKSMVEVGSYWGYYSLWYAAHFDKPLMYQIEPISDHISAGKKNGALNQQSGMYIQEGIGPGMFNLDRFIRSEFPDGLGILHSDIQGAEDYLLREGVTDLLREKKIEYLFVSTHAQQLHEELVQFLSDIGYWIIADADPDNDTFSYDGLIVAADKEQKMLDIFSRSTDSIEKCLTDPHVWARL